MIQIKPTHIKTQIQTDLLELIENIDGEYTLTLEDVDDLHDCTIESWDICQIDRIHDEIYGLLPQIFDECVELIEEEQDTYDPWREHCDRDFYGV